MRVGLCRAPPIPTSHVPCTHRRRPASPRRGGALVSRGWRDDSPIGGGDGDDTKKTKKKQKMKKLKVGEKGKGSVDDAKLTTIDLGQGKFVSLYTMEDTVADLDVAADSINAQTLESFRDELYGAGDVVWPASLALARLVAHCPSLVKGKRVLEVGSGLGLVGNVAAQAGAAEVCMVDVDAEVLKLAAKSAKSNAAQASDPDHECTPVEKVSTAVLDWTKPQSWPAGKYDVVIAADVLYDENAVPCVAEVVSRVMRAGKGGEDSGGEEGEEGTPAAAAAAAPAMAIFSDPKNRTNRDAFADRAIALGLETVEADFPGHPDMKLVQATRVELKLGAA